MNTRPEFVSVAAQRAAVIFLATFVGCAPAYIYGRTAPQAPAAKALGCAFSLLDKIPQLPFDEVGVIAPEDIEYGDMAGGVESFKSAVGAHVCAAGGDAVIVERDWTGRYIRGTVIVYGAAVLGAIGAARAPGLTRRPLPKSLGALPAER